MDQLAPPGHAGGVSAYSLDLQTGALAPHGPSGVGVGDDPVCVVVVDAGPGAEEVIDPTRRARRSIVFGQLYSVGLSGPSKACVPMSAASA